MNAGHSAKAVLAMVMMRMRRVTIVVVRVLNDIVVFLLESWLAAWWFGCVKM